MITDSQIAKFKARSDRINLLFQWVKDDTCSLKEFQKLIELDKEERLKQISLDME